MIRTFILIVLVNKINNKPIINLKDAKVFYTKKINNKSSNKEIYLPILSNSIEHFQNTKSKSKSKSKFIKTKFFIIPIIVIILLIFILKMSK